MTLNVTLSALHHCTDHLTTPSATAGAYYKQPVRPGTVFAYLGAVGSGRWCCLQSWGCMQVLHLAPTPCAPLQSWLLLPAGSKTTPWGQPAATGKVAATASAAGPPEGGGTDHAALQV